MNFDHLMKIVRDEPVFETGLLLAGDVDPNHIRRQLTRWTNNDRLYQLRRGLYALAPPYQSLIHSQSPIAWSLARMSAAYPRLPTTR